MNDNIEKKEYFSEEEKRLKMCENFYEKKKSPRERLKDSFFRIKDKNILSSSISVPKRVSYTSKKGDVFRLFIKEDELLLKIKLKEVTFSNYKVLPITIKFEDLINNSFSGSLLKIEKKENCDNYDLTQKNLEEVFDYAQNVFSLFQESILTYWLDRQGLAFRFSNLFQEIVFEELINDYKEQVYSSPEMMSEIECYFEELETIEEKIDRVCREAASEFIYESNYCFEELDGINELISLQENTKSSIF